MNRIKDIVMNLLLGNHNEVDIEDEDYEQIEQDMEMEASKPAPEPLHTDWPRHIQSKGKVHQLQPQPIRESKSEILIVRPTDLDSATYACDGLKANKICVVILEGIEYQTAQRISDFIGGTLFSLDGHIERLSDAIFVAAPESVNISNGERAQIKKAVGYFDGWSRR
jgi:cell division inhibitor SepF